HLSDFCCVVFFFSSRRRHTRFSRDWSSDVCSSDLTYFIEADSKAFPYISAGAGYALNSTKSDQNAAFKTNFFVWGGKAGLAYFITPSIAIDLGLNYQQLSTKYEQAFNTPESKVIFKTLGASIGFNFVL